jgi:hypothetical protein
MNLVFTMSTTRSIAWRGKQTELLTANQTAGFDPGNSLDRGSQFECDDRGALCDRPR